MITALPTLVVAGPGTGKTRTIVANSMCDLVSAGVDPTRIFWRRAFSNKAAEEMRERNDRRCAALTRPELGGRVEISTFHATWGLNFHRQYGHHVGLPLDDADPLDWRSHVLLRRRLADLPLWKHPRDLRDPGRHLGQIITRIAISRAKDELCDPEPIGNRPKSRRCG